MFEGGGFSNGRSRAEPVDSDQVMPTESEVVVIGGGIVGVSAALCLAEQGVSVTLCEKGVIAGEASGRAIGWIDSQYMSPAKMELISRAKTLWGAMDERVAGTTGYRRTGMISVFGDEDHAGMAEHWLDRVRGMSGVDARVLTEREALELLPEGAEAPLGALYQPSDGVAEPTSAAPAIARAAQRKGAVLLQHCAVRKIETVAGRVDAVITEKGAIRTRHVVVAGGVWSPSLLRPLGLQLPQLHAHASAMRFRAESTSGPNTSALLPEGIYRSNGDGSYTLGAVNGAAPITPATLRHFFSFLPAIRRMWSEIDPVFSLDTFKHELSLLREQPADSVSVYERIRFFEPQIRQRFLEKVMGDFAAQYPLFRQGVVEERWSGALVSTPDNMPVISSVDSVAGLVLGTGLYYGLTMGPAAGEALAAIITGKKADIDLSGYRYSRFHDGTKLQFQD